MPTYFCLTVRFLQPYCYGRGDAGEPEWPPSPLRVFQALVAAAAARWNERLRLEYAAPALRWLEAQQSPPIVAANGVRSAVKYRLYVPDNVADKVAKSWSGGREATIADYRTEKDVCPTNLNGDAVAYLFPLPESGCPYVEVLTAAARSITHLGWGIDVVAGNAEVISEADTAKLPGELWRPVEDASAIALRVPIGGTLDALIAKHHAFLNRLGPDGFKPVPPLSTFRVVGYRRTTDIPGRQFAAFKLLHPDQERLAYFSATRSNCVAAMTRHATAAAAQGLSWVDSFVHGHRASREDTKPRFSYLPLPTIEPRGDGALVVGGIRRVLLAELNDGTESHLSWARQMLPGQFLIDERTKDPKAMLVPANESDWVLRRYIDPVDTWATVTPVVLPGSDEGKFAKAEKLFFKALRHAGYSPAALATNPEFRNVSFWRGGELALSFQRPDYLKKDHWSVYHMLLRWKRPAKGPIAIGAGRHCGLGIFAAIEK
jgi:CRISPR-associated protein Csb2